MSGLAVIALCLLGLASDVKASGFGLGSSIPIDDGVRAVDFHLGNGFQFQAAGLRVGLVEVRTALTNNTIQRTSLLYAGPLALRTPMRVETVELAAPALLILALLFLAVPVSRCMPARRAKQRTSVHDGVN